MANKRPPRRVVNVQPWPVGTTVNEVIAWAAQRAPEYLLLFEAAYRKRDLVQMEGNMKLLRGVVTRVDAFRRMRVREWSAEQSANSNTGEKTE